MSAGSTAPQAPLPAPSDLIAASRATSDFKEALLRFQAEGAAGPHIRFHRTGNPPVKVLRAILGLIESHPDLEFDTVEVSGASGCSDYRGSIRVLPSGREFRFVWDCAWKARQLGWEDHFGYPDQSRAAREFGHRCFQEFVEVTTPGG